MGVAASASTHPGGALAARALSDPPLVCRRTAVAGLSWNGVGLWGLRLNESRGGHMEPASHAERRGRGQSA